MGSWLRGNVMSKLRDDVQQRTADQPYDAWCWNALSDEYQAKFAARPTAWLALKIRRMDGYESLSRNDDIIMAGIRHLIAQRVGQ